METINHIMALVNTIGTTVIILAGAGLTLLVALRQGKLLQTAASERAIATLNVLKAIAEIAVGAAQTWKEKSRDDGMQVKGSDAFAVAFGRATAHPMLPKGINAPAVEDAIENAYLKLKSGVARAMEGEKITPIVSGKVEF